MGSELVSHVLRVMQSRPCENLNSLALQEEFGMEAPQSPLGGRRQHPAELSWEFGKQLIILTRCGCWWLAQPWVLNEHNSPEQRLGGG